MTKNFAMVGMLASLVVMGTANAAQEQATKADYTQSWEEVQARFTSSGWQKMSEVRELIESDEKLSAIMARTEKLFWDRMNQAADTNRDLEKVGEQLKAFRERLADGDQLSSEEWETYYGQSELILKTKRALQDDQTFQKRLSQRDNKLYQKMIERHAGDPRLEPFLADS